MQIVPVCLQVLMASMECAVDMQGVKVGALYTQSKGQSLTVPLGFSKPADQMKLGSAL